MLTPHLFVLSPIRRHHSLSSPRAETSRAALYRSPVKRAQARAAAASPPSLAVAVARSLVIALCAALAILSVMARALHAQQPKSASQPAATTPSSTPPSPSKEPGIGAAFRRSADRHGLWGAVGVGRADAGLDCTVCANESSRAYAVHGTLGIRITPRFLVGAETFAWLDVIGGGVDRIVRGTHLVGRSYPFARSPLFVQGGLGVASFEVNDGDVAFLTRSASLSMAVGVDWRLAGMTVSPSIAAVTTTGGKLTSDRTGNAVTENARLGLLRTSVALSWFR